ncbi:MAG: hypothetical protein RPT25_00615 [Cycloclasticus sp.]|jgi:hypothetical protein
MKLSIRYVKEHGALEKERIVLKVLDNVDVGNYMLADTTYIADEEVSNRLRHTFWIPDKAAEKGDIIVIYTKPGDDFTQSNKSGNKTHFFYWGLKRTVWNKERDAAALFLLNDWSSTKV